MRERLFISFLFALAVRTALCDQVCNFASSYLASSANVTTTCHLSMRFLDQGSAYQIHDDFPSDYWVINGWYNQPNLGAAGTANGGLGFNGSDFELPLFRLGNEDAPDPDVYIINGETGLVGIKCTSLNQFENCGQLDPYERLPVYNYRGRSPLFMVTSPDTFYNFFHPAIENTQVKLNFTFTRNQFITALQQFNASLYFPLDNLGFNDTGYLSDNKTKHNFGFCMIMNMRFTYKGGEYILIAGDDDIFVYINGSLVVDLGGVHNTLNSTVYVDDMKLVLGNTYRLDIFKCERHTPTSALAVNTTIDIYCAYTDVCGLCEGDGTSCCNITACDDHNVCTIDSCNATTACVHTPISCAAAAQDLCFTVTNTTCDPINGCNLIPINCTDNNPCTNDVCTPGIGCQFLPQDCDDLDPCTIDSCSNTTGMCVYTDRICAAPNNCTLSSCYPYVGCVYAPVSCVAPDACSTSVCLLSNGSCNTSAIVCNDNNNCTNDSCDPVYGCVFAPVSCSANISNCSKVCVSSSPNCTNSSSCNDGITCTIDTCVNGTCQHKPLCPPGTPCNPIECQAGVCVSQPFSCDFGNLCLTGSCYSSDNITASCNLTTTECSNSTCGAMECDSATGQCVVPQLDCNDGNPCTFGYTACGANSTFCDYAYNTTACNDNNLCTNDYCNVGANGTKSCTYTNVTCIPPSVCLKVNSTACNPKTGCSFVPVVCPAVNNFCQTSVCDDVAGCIVVEKACPVSDNVCYQGVCSNSTRSCSTVARPNWDLIVNRNGQTCTAAYAINKATFWTLRNILIISICGGVGLLLIIAGIVAFVVIRGGKNKAENPLYDGKDGRGKNPLYG